MPKTYRGTTIPAARGDLLAGLETAFDTTLSFTRTATIESANALVAQAKADGKNVTSANPMLFLLNNWFPYAHNGTTMYSLSRMQSGELTYSGDASWQTLNKGATRTILSSSLAAAPYPRKILVFGSIGANVGKGDGAVAGRVYLRINLMDMESGSLGWMDEGIGQTTTTFDLATIPADTAPKLKLQLRSPSDGAKMDIWIASLAQMNRLAYIAWPISADGEDS